MLTMFRENYCHLSDFHKVEQLRYVVALCLEIIYSDNSNAVRIAGAQKMEVSMCSADLTKRSILVLLTMFGIVLAGSVAGCEREIEEEDRSSVENCISNVPKG